MKRVLFFFLVCIAVFAPLAEGAMNFSPDQLQQFNQLSDDEKQKLMGQFSESGITSRINSSEKKVAQPKVVKPRTGLSKKTPVVKSEIKNDRYKKFWPSSWDESGLKRYGYELFAGSPTTFAPVSEIPVPYNYIMGPGDEVVLQLFGKTSRKYNLIVTREGVIQIPDFGPVNVAGMSFDEMKSLLKNKVRKEAVGDNINISLGNLRSMKVFVLGEAYKPGAYTISSLSTVSNALFVSGGIKNIGSLRKIQVKRDNQVIDALDLYDFLILGDMKNDIRLLPGDVIFIPTVGDQVGIKGNVKRPGVYELKDENTLGDIITLSGGLWNGDKVQFVRVYRTEKNGIRVCTTVDINKPGWENIQVKNGDLIDVPMVEKSLKESVFLNGNVFVPGMYEYTDSITLNTLISSKEMLMNNTDLDYGLILREKSRFDQYSLISFSPEKILKKEDDIKLESKDRIFFFAKDSRRFSEIKPAIDLINERNNKRLKYPPLVEITGNVYFPGIYPVAGNDTLSSVLSAGGGVKPDTDINYGIIERKSSRTGEISSLKFDIEKDKSIKIIPGDKLYVFNISSDRPGILKNMIKKLKAQADNYSMAKVITIKGKVKFPGEYPLVPGMSVKELIGYSGGFLESAFTRYGDLVRYFFDKNLNLKVRRFNIFFSNNSSDDTSGYNFKLNPGDKLVIKKIPSWDKKPEVRIEGEVNFPGTYFVEKKETLTNLIAMAGGLTEDAFPEGTVFMRKELKEKERKRYDSYINLLSAQLGTRRFKEESGKEGNKSDQVILSIIERLKTAKVSGRLVIDLPGILKHKKTDIILKDKDVLFIPGSKQEVTVMGEVYSPMSHLYDKNMMLFDYIDASGGFTESASTKRTYIIKANGRVVPYKNGTKGFFASKNTDIDPGDTIVVPYDVTAISPLVLWGDVTKILYQMSTSIAALSAVGVF